MSLPKLGKLAVRHDPRTLRLKKYLVGLNEFGAVPVQNDLDLGKLVPTWPMYGNDRLGDCTCAAAGHMIQLWSAMVGAVVTPPDHDILDAYTVLSPGDDGCVELDVLNFWRSSGFGERTIDGYASLDLGNRYHLKLALTLFGGIYLGVALPVSCQNQDVWDVVPSGDGGMWGGHAVNVVAYDTFGVTVVTWGAPKKMTWAFWAKYVDEAYAILTNDWKDKVPGTEGFALLEKDLEALDAA